MIDLYAEAQRLGVAVQTRSFPKSRQGCYLDGAGIIYLSDQLGEGMWMRCVLAHELGHAYYGHTVTTPATEKQADERAADLLIDPGDYARAERMSDNPDFIAHELDITRRLVRAYQRRLHRFKAVA